jgi:hypothetical protein
MLHIKKLIFALNKLSKQIKWNSINAPFLKFVIFFGGGAVTVTARPVRRTSSYAIAQRNNIE